MYYLKSYYALQVPGLRLRDPRDLEGLITSQIVHWRAFFISFTTSRIERYLFRQFTVNKGFHIAISAKYSLMQIRYSDLRNDYSYPKKSIHTQFIDQFKKKSLLKSVKFELK